MLKSVLILISVCFPILFGFSQNMDSHLWNNRVVLLFTDSFENKQFQDQKIGLLSSKKELLERKLIVYTISKDYYQTIFENQRIPTQKRFYKKYNTDDASFRIILIGLDGGIKMDTTKFTSPLEIFKMIDQMPMRQYELQQNN